MKKALELKLAVAAATVLVAATAQSAVVNIQFDLNAGTLTANADAVNGLDQFASGPIAFGPTPVLIGEPFRLNVSFVDAVTATGQSILMQQQGLGFATFSPTTFGSISNPMGAHAFGPSLILSGSSTPTSASAVVSPAVVAGALAADFAGLAPGSCAANSCDFGVIFPDLIDGLTEIRLSGFTVDFTLGLAQTTIFNSFGFRLIAPALTTTNVPEPGTVALLLAALAAAACYGRAVRRRSVGVIGRLAAQ